MTASQPASQKKKTDFKSAFRLKFVESYKRISARKKKVDQGRYTMECEQMSNKTRYNMDLFIKTRGTRH